MHAPTLHHRFPKRRAGAFGQGTIGRIAEALTKSWFRWNATLAWIVVVLAIIGAPGAGMGERIVLALASPIVAVVFAFSISITFWLASVLPGVGMAFGLIRLIYTALFSRLVVEEAPSLDAPLWISRR